MVVTIETNALEVAGLLGRLFRDQVPFALSQAINDVAKEAQTVQRAHQRRVFTVRRPQFVDRAVKIRPFSTKRSPVAVLRIEPPGGRARADILTKFEDQTVKRPRDGRSIAVPSKVKRTAAGIVRKAERPSALELRGSGRVLRGARGTYLIRTPRGGVIIQRSGRRGAKQSRVLYYLEPEVRIRPDLDFVENITRVVGARFEDRFSARFDLAVRTAR